MKFYEPSKERRVDIACRKAIEALSSEYACAIEEQRSPNFQRALATSLAEILIVRSDSMVDGSAFGFTDCINLLLSTDSQPSEPLRLCPWGQEFGKPHPCSVDHAL